jgi:broad specificity phosphatase PhoE
MTTFHLVRHGSNDWLGKGLAGRAPGTHLNETGRDEAKAINRALEKIQIDQVYSSPLERCLETIQPFLDRTGHKALICEELLEVEFGEWTQRTFTDLEMDERWKLWNAFRSGAQAPGGERMTDVQARITQFMQRMVSAQPGKSVLLATHGDIIRTALMYYLAIPMDFIHRLEVSPGSISTVRLGPGLAEVLRINDIP